MKKSEKDLMTWVSNYAGISRKLWLHLLLLVACFIGIVEIAWSFGRLQKSFESRNCICPTPEPTQQPTPEPTTAERVAKEIEEKKWETFLDRKRTDAVPLPFYYSVKWKGITAKILLEDAKSKDVSGGSLLAEAYEKIYGYNPDSWQGGENAERRKRDIVRGNERGYFLFDSICYEQFKLLHKAFSGMFVILSNSYSCNNCNGPVYVVWDPVTKLPELFNFASEALDFLEASKRYLENLRHEQERDNIDLLKRKKDCD